MSRARAPASPAPARPERKEFRTLVSFEEAARIMAGLAPARRLERVSLTRALDRVLGVEVAATADVPPFTRSVMDGYAVRAEDSFGADEERPVELLVVGRAEAGRPSPAEVGPGLALEIATGAALPTGANAVVKVEHTDRHGDRVRLRRGVAPGENLMSAGDDLMAGDTVLEPGRRLGPVQVAALAAAGETEVSVWARPRVGILSTGDEVLPAGAALGPGQIHDANAAFLAAAVTRAGGEPVPLGIAPDDRSAIRGALDRAAGTCDLVLTSGSTSAGAGDVVYRVLEEEGELLAHGVRVEPGKPTALARLRGVPVAALPGNPASAAVVFEALVAPVIRTAAGLDPEPERRRLRAVLASEIRTSPGRRLLRMVGVVDRGDRARAYPIEKRSGAITLLALADGYVDVPEDVARLDAGTEVEVVLLEDRSALPDALVVGSHCLGLRVLFREIAPLRARSVHVGSLGGVRAVTRGVADAAGIHLLEPDGGGNAEALARLGVRGVALVRGYRRRQGWIVPAGNPAGIRGLADLVDRGARIVNRVPGSGTRMLLEELLRAEAAARGASAADLAARLHGFDVEAASHSAVAAAVRLGTAEAGLGIEAAARLNGLEFVPVAEESYDFLLSSSSLGSPFGAAIRVALATPTFQRALGRLPGYRVPTDAGAVIWTAPQGDVRE